MRKVTKEQAEGEIDTALEAYRKRRPKGRKKPRPQAYPETIQVMLKAFLLERKEDAMRAYASAETIAAKAPSVPGTLGQLEYWKRCLQAIDWCLSYVHQKQRHLEDVQF